MNICIYCLLTLSVVVSTFAAVRLSSLGIVIVISLLRISDKDVVFIT